MIVPAQTAALAIASLLAAGCSDTDTPRNKARIQPMLAAVMHAKTDEVRRLAAQGVGLNERYYTNNDTPMIFAAAANRWSIVEILIDHGADIWAHDNFGITTAEMAHTSRIVPGTGEDHARLRVIAKLKARGYPFPPPKSDAVLQLVKDGRWPPKELTR